MNYFYIRINKKIDILKDTVELIKQFNLHEKNLSIVVKKDSLNNCTLDKQSDFDITVYSESNKLDYNEFKQHYLKKYNITESDLSIILQSYSVLNIDSIEQSKVQVKISYNFSMINALQFVIDLMGLDEPLCKLLSNEGEVFNQVLTNSTEFESFIVSDNTIYKANYHNGQYLRQEVIKNSSEIISKYLFFKSLDKKLSQKAKQCCVKI